MGWGECGMGWDELALNEIKWSEMQPDTRRGVGVAWDVVGLEDVEWGGRVRVGQDEMG